ncbi:MAG: hypothetical protein IPM45_17450 [Acidimicrobiales bacterium]|nr:hypothetical protein [Acidimicrobiales bacterium]
MRRLVHPSLGAVVGLAFALWGLVIGLQPLGDNSFLTHLATGRLILDGGIPRADPYSFTASGLTWVVQSWLASLVYGLVDRWWGGHGLQLLTGALTAALALLVWRLTRPAEQLLGRIALAGVVLAVGTGAWSERPLLVGLVLLALTLVVLGDDGPPPWVLVPVFWLWVNVHGSFPLGLVAIVVVALGRWFDARRPARDLLRLDALRQTRGTRALGWAVAGTLLGAVNPLGPRLLVFPVELLGRSDVLQFVVEWQAPTFTGWWQRLFLVQVAAAVLVLTRRPSWCLGLVLASFLPLALISSRNVAVASLVLVAAMAPQAKGLGTIGTARRSLAVTLGAVALVAGGAVAVAAALSSPAFRFDGYPVAALAWADGEGLLGPDQRVVTPDLVGNYLEYRRGADANVFVDDRYDMYPREVVDDLVVLHQGGERWQEVLDDWDTTAVVWPADLPLSTILETSPAWRIAYADDDWVVAVPSGR